MDDLISRSALMEHFESMSDECNLFRWRSPKKIKQGLKSIVARQPTVYNVDKVVEQIENLKDLDNREQHCAKTKELDKCGDFDDCEQCILEKAISFVKVGGVNG